MDERHSWFEDWFNTLYYHILYQNRDEQEARLFIDTLISYLEPAPTSHFLDLACGKGRHSVYLHKKGYRVTGVDLSASSIEFARQYSKPGLMFRVHDMRIPLAQNEFDYILNLFTSFGYFDDPADNKRTLQSIYTELKPGGIFVLDFFNSRKVLATLVPEQTIERNSLVFHIKKRYEGGYIYKDIRFSDAGKQFTFTEKVEALDHDELVQMLQSCGFKLVETWGSYQCHHFDPDTSDRLILISQKA